MQINIKTLITIYLGKQAQLLSLLGRQGRAHVTNYNLQGKAGMLFPAIVVSWLLLG